MKIFNTMIIVLSIFGGSEFLGMDNNTLHEELKVIIDNFLMLSNKQDNKKEVKKRLSGKKKKVSSPKGLSPISRKLQRTASPECIEELKGKFNLEQDFRSGFLKTIKEHKVKMFLQLLSNIKDINFTDPKTGNTPLIETVKQVCIAEKKESKFLSQYWTMFTKLMLHRYRNIKIDLVNCKKKSAISIAEHYRDLCKEDSKAGKISSLLTKIHSCNKCIRIIS